MWTGSGNGWSPGLLFRAQENSREKVNLNRPSATWVGVSGEAAQAQLADSRPAVYSVSAVEREAVVAKRNEISEQLRVGEQSRSGEVGVG
jgi:hypothetical protein